MDNEWLDRERQRRRADAIRLRNELGWSNKCVFLFAGRLVSQKGVDVLVDAMNELCANREEAALAIVGTGPLEESLRKRLAPDTSRHVRFLGKSSYSEMPLYYALADVFVLPSRHEPWGLVVNEAMQCGLPVIATACCGSAHDLLPHGRTGIKIEPASAAALVDAMRWMVDHPEERRAMGKSAREWVSAWSFDRTIRGFRAAIDDAVGAASESASEGPPSACRAA